MATQRTHILRDPGIAKLEQIEAGLQQNGLPPLLRHLVKLRVSQINGCAFCVGMHTREAREDGETEDRLDRLVVWQHVRNFSPAERAALAWAEALTTRGEGADLGKLHNALEEHFSHDDIGALTMVVVMINSWNRLQIASHHPFF
ncbi:MAG: carboxymuconolactone decarboxylase family protein [Pseudomonadota bacterium]